MKLVLPTRPEPLEVDLKRTAVVLMVQLPRIPAWWEVLLGAMKVGAVAVPREIEFVTELPKTISGKIRRVELRDRERQRKRQ